MKYSKFIALLFCSSSLFAQNLEFDANRIIYFQDSDYNYNSAETKVVNKSGQDLLGSYTFPLQFSEDGNELTISNSAVNHHRMLAVNSNRKVIYILETKGALNKGDKNIALEDLPEGNYVNVFYYKKTGILEPAYRFPVAFNPTAISLDPSEKYLAISSETGGNEVVVYELDDFGKPIRNVPRVNFFESGAVTDVVWHPKNDFILFVRKESKDLGLVKVVKDKGSIIRLEQYGDVVKFDGNPNSAIFSKDGKHIFVLDEGSNNSNGQVFLIKLNLENDGKHALLSKVDVEENPSQISIHPNGENLLVANSKQSFSEKSFGNSSLTVLNFKNDLLSFNSRFDLVGILPSQVKFDKSGKNFMISFFQTKAYGRKMGAINFYKFTSGSKSTITKQDTQINLPAGVHHIEVLP